MAVRGKTASDAVHVLVHFLVQRRLCVGHVLIQLAVQLFAALGLLLYVCGAILRCTASTNARVITPRSRSSASARCGGCCCCCCSSSSCGTVSSRSVASGSGCLCCLTTRSLAFGCFSVKKAIAYFVQFSCVLFTIPAATPMRPSCCFTKTEYNCPKGRVPVPTSSGEAHAHLVTNPVAGQYRDAAPEKKHLRIIKLHHGRNSLHTLCAGIRPHDTFPGQIPSNQKYV